MYVYNMHTWRKNTPVYLYRTALGSPTMSTNYWCETVMIPGIHSSVLTARRGTEHLSEHTRWSIYYPVHTHLNSFTVLKCKMPAHSSRIIVIDAETFWVKCVFMALCRWGMQSQSSSCWCGWRRRCHRGRRRSWQLQNTLMSVAGEGWQKRNEM